MPGLGMPYSVMSDASDITEPVRGRDPCSTLGVKGAGNLPRH